MTILLTGGAGYIGSVTNKILNEYGIKTVVFDNLSTGHIESIPQAEFIKGDLRNKDAIHRVFEKHQFDAVVHFAALALAGESMKVPYSYYENNIMGGLNLLEAMRAHNVGKFIFSSTCAVYGYPEKLPVSENESYKPVSVYGSSKRMFEEILEWYDTIYGIKHIALRYFNAAGASEDGTLGEDHPDESHIIPIAISVAMGERKEFTLFGDDYQTPDGTCIRDYIHVVDLAHAHRLAVSKIIESKQSMKCNLGVGKGFTNMEVLKAVESVSGKSVPIKKGDRRPGDPDAIYADNAKAKHELSWNPEFTDIHSIVESAWKWHTSHPKGYGE